MSAAEKPSLPITVIGSYPKPACCNIPSWFDRLENDLPNQKEFSIEKYTEWKKNVSTEELEKNLEKGYKEVIEVRKYYCFDSFSHYYDNIAKIFHAN